MASKIRVWLDDDTEVELFPNGQAHVELTDLRVYGRYAEGFMWVEPDGSTRPEARYLTWHVNGDRLTGRAEESAVRAVLKMVPRARRLARESLREHAASAVAAKKTAAKEPADA